MLIQNQEGNGKISYLKCKFSDAYRTISADNFGIFFINNNRNDLLEGFRFKIIEWYDQKAITKRTD